MCSKSSHHLLPSTCDSATNRCARQCLRTCPAPTSISCCYSNTSFHLDSDICTRICPSKMIPLIEKSSIVGSSSPTYLLKFFVPGLLVCWPSGHHTILRGLVNIKSLDINPYQPPPGLFFLFTMCIQQDQRVFGWMDLPCATLELEI